MNNKYLKEIMIDNKDEIIQECMNNYYKDKVETNPYQKLKFKEDMGHHIETLSNAILVDSVLIFENYMCWTLDLFKVLKLSIDSFEMIYNDLIMVIKPYFDAKDWLIVKKFLESGAGCFGTKRKTRFIHSPFYEKESTRYIDFLLKARRKEAFDYIVELAETIPIEDIYVYIFQESMYRIGMLWQRHEISIATEHYCTASTQYIMTYFYPQIFKVQKNGHVCVSTCIEGELHELGIRMISDILELEGFRTYYLGANTPIHDIIDKAIEVNADIIAISTVLIEKVDKVAELIELIRYNKKCDKMKIIVGGRPFIIDEQLWDKIGADGYAKDAIEAITLVMELIEEPNIKNYRGELNERRR